MEFAIFQSSVHFRKMDSSPGLCEVVPVAMPVAMPMPVPMPVAMPIPMPMCAAGSTTAAEADGWGDPHCAARPASPVLFHQRALVKTLWNISLITATGGKPRNVSPQTEEHVVCS